MPGAILGGMSNAHRRISWLCLLAILAAGCGAFPKQSAPGQGYQYRQLLLDEPFDSARHWRSYDGGGEIWLGVTDGAYRIDIRGRRYVWTQREQAWRDAVIEVETRQLSAYDHNAYGVACRLQPDNSGRGYFFLISGDGYASIRFSDGRALQPIVQAFPSRHVRQGQARNLLRVVCLEDYLALWVNGEFVAEARDKRASDGAVGLAGVMNYAGKRLTVDFDDLRVYAAAIDRRAR